MTDTAGRRPTARPATPTPTPPPTPAVAPTYVEPTRSRTFAASRAWLGTRTWPAYCAAGITAAYGVLKAYWVFGGTALWAIAPLSQSMIEKARSHTAAPGWFVIADAATVVLAVAGVSFALATVRPRRWLPVWLARCALWPPAALMVLRAMSATLGDMHQLATGASTRTTLWDLVLRSPLFPDLGSAVGSNRTDVCPPRQDDQGTRWIGAGVRRA